MNIYFNLFGGLLFLCSIVSQALAADDRMGVLYPEEKQRQAAILNASNIGNDSALPDPLVPLTIDTLSNLDSSSESVIEEKVEDALRPVSLEEQIQDQQLNDELDQFGYDIFSRVPSTFAPVQGVPVPPDYVVGPGDSFIVQVFSGVDVQYNLVVTREGKLLVPEIGDLQVAGLTFKEVKTLVSEVISRTRLGVKVVVTLTELQSIQIMLVGEVQQPGSYTVSGLSSLLNTLITTGGVKRTGSLRSISVKRLGETIATLDLYDLLLKGDTSSNIYLRNGDVIFIPPIRNVVSIAGEVVRPAIYEIKHEETVTDVINLAGGLLATANPSKTQIERIENSGSYSLLQVKPGSISTTSAIKNGDLIRIFPVVDKVERAVLLDGNVQAPGGFEWFDGMRVTDLVPDKSSLLQSTDFTVAMIERENTQSKRTEIIYFNLGTALQNPSSDANLKLSARDRLTVFDTEKRRSDLLSGIVSKLKAQASAEHLPKIVEVKGATRHPGVFPMEEGMRLLDLVTLSGGMKSGVDQDYSILVRTSPSSQNIEFINLKLKFSRSNKQHNPVLFPGDRLYLFDHTSNRSQLMESDLKRIKEQSRYGNPAPIVEISGSVAKPGRYPMVPGMRLKDLIEASGGLNSDAFGKAATLSRNVQLDNQYSRTDQMAVSLIADDPMLKGLNMILAPKDHLVIRQKPEWIAKPKRVTVAGEIKHPGTYEIDKRETLCGLVNRAGGFTDEAYLFGAVFTRESVRKREQEAIDRIHRQMDDLLADVHISPGLNKDTKLPVNQGTWDTYQVVSRLSKEKAIGRMVIDLERAAAKCDENWDLALEDGDRLLIPRFKQEVSVAGQVYYPQSHQYRKEKGAIDYINLSGGTKELAQREHAYVVQANGQVISLRSPASTWGWLMSPSNVKVTPGSTIYVPLSVDRINGREFTESWIDLIYKLTLSASSVSYLFGK